MLLKPKLRHFATIGMILSPCFRCKKSNGTWLNYDECEDVWMRGPSNPPNLFCIREDKKKHDNLQVAEGREPPDRATVEGNTEPELLAHTTPHSSIITQRWHSGSSSWPRKFFLLQRTPGRPQDAVAEWGRWVQVLSNFPQVLFLRYVLSMIRAIIHGAQYESIR